VGWSVLGPSRGSSKASSLRITVYPISGKEALSPGPPVHQNITSTESRRQERQIRPAYQSSTGPLVLSPTRSHGALQPHHQNRRTIWKPSRSITTPRLRSSPTRSRRQRHGRSVATCGLPSRPKLLPKDHPHLDHPPQLAPRMARLACSSRSPLQGRASLCAHRNRRSRPVRAWHALVTSLVIEEGPREASCGYGLWPRWHGKSGAEYACADGAGRMGRWRYDGEICVVDLRWYMMLARARRFETGKQV
jgi:hypothetical protein